MTDMRTDLAPIDPSTLPSPAPDGPVEALEWLGGTADEVAENLRLRGIKGTRVKADDCPLARYLHEWWPCASVWQNTAVWDWSPVVNHQSGPTPEPCFEFAQKFDQREYPDLLA